MPPAPPDNVNIGRLKRRKDFIRVAKQGQSFAVRGLVLQAFHRQKTNQNLLADARIGFTVTKKIGAAVSRNRARRRLKAAATEVIPPLAQKNTDYVLIARTSTLKRPFTLLVADLETAMGKINLDQNR